MQAAESDNSAAAWTFSQCLDYAYSNNISLQRLVLDNQSDDATLEQSKAQWQPTLGFSTTQGYINYASPSENQTANVYSGSYGLNASWTVFNGNIRRNQIKYDEMQQRISALGIDEQRYTYEYRKTNYERDRKLHDKKLISDYDYETSRNEYDVARLAYQKSKADRVKATENLGYAEIYAPIDGIVISREVEIGQTVVANMTVANIFTIADLDNMQVIADVDEADIGQVKVGQRVTFSVDAYPDDVFNGKVTQVRLNPTEESNVITYEVVVSADNADHKLIPGLTANITIYTAESQNALIVPASALKFSPKDIDDESLPQKAQDAPADAKAVVWTVRGDKLYPVAVTTGTNNGVNVEIVSGLKKGDVVAVDYSADMAAQQAGGSEESSPFAPKHPGQKKKEGQK